jgi:hypothetical protein
MQSCRKIILKNGGSYFAVIVNYVPKRNERSNISFCFLLNIFKNKIQLVDNRDNAFRCLTSLILKNFLWHVAKFLLLMKNSQDISEFEIGRISSGRYVHRRFEAAFDVTVADFP